MSLITQGPPGLLDGHRGRSHGDYVAKEPIEKEVPAGAMILVA